VLNTILLLLALRIPYTLNSTTTLDQAIVTRLGRVLCLQRENEGVTCTVSIVYVKLAYWFRRTISQILLKLAGGTGRQAGDVCMYNSMFHEYE